MLTVFNKNIFVEKDKSNGGDYQQQSASKHK